MNYDITIHGEYFKTFTQYSSLANRIYIHSSLGGRVNIDNCTFDFSLIGDDILFKQWFNDLVGFEMLNVTPMIFTENNIFPRKQSYLYQIYSY